MCTPARLSDGGLLSWDAWDLREGKDFSPLLSGLHPKRTQVSHLLCQSSSVLFPPFWCTWAFSHFIIVSGGAAFIMDREELSGNPQAWTFYRHP